MGKKNGIYTVNGSEVPKAPLVCSLRLFLAFLAFLGFFLCYAQRNGLSVSIVCMTNSSADITIGKHESEHKTMDIPEACQKHKVEDKHSPGQILFWPKQTRGNILGSFYWGYALTQIAASVAGNFLGPKRFLALVIFISSLSTFLIPAFAKIDWRLVALLRVIAGAAQGGLWPTIFRFWASWAPESERTTLFSFQSSGPSMGTILSLIIGGLLCTYDFGESLMSIFRFGWAYFFYIFGGLGMLWSIVWLIFASDSPSTNERISNEEKEYIRQCKLKEKIQDKKTKTPWLRMFKSQGFWCILLTMFFCDFGLYAIWAVVPEYMNEVLMFNISENGLLSSLPHIASFIVVLLTGSLADVIIGKKYLSRVNTRKLFHTIGTLSPAICLLGISFLDCQHRYLAVILLVIGFALNGFMMSGGYVVNVSDFSGVHSGVLFGVCNTISSIGGYCAPYITSWITINKKASEWRLAFIMYSVSFLISGVVFLFFARGETEAWARSEENEQKLEKNHDEEKELMEITSEKGKQNPIV